MDGGNLARGLAAAVFAVTFLLLALGRVGRLSVPRGLAALVGGLATAMLLGLSWRAIDLQVIVLLAGLMVLAGLAQAANLFAGVRRRLVHLHPALSLWLCILLVAVTSAVLLNDAAIVVLVPFLLPVLERLRLPLPGSVALLAVAANVGSLLTPFGNPQNAVLAHEAHLGVADFLRTQGPMVAAGLAILAIPCWRLGARKIETARIEPPPPVHAFGRPWLVACILVFLALAVVGSRWGVSLGVAAVLCAALAWLGLRLDLGRVADFAAWRGLDLNVIALFVGLYWLTDGLARWLPPSSVPVASLSTPVAAGLVTTLLSNVVGNVPAILVLVRLDAAWVVDHAPFLVTVSTLGGTLFLTGSAASLLAADQARKSGVQLGFLAYLRVAVPWTLPLLVLGAWWTW